MFLKKLNPVSILLFLFLIFSSLKIFCTYELSTYFESNELMNEMKCSTRDDPFKGNTLFLDYSQEKDKNMIKNEDSKLKVNLDYTEISAGNKRNSIRLESSTTFDEGVFVLDFSKIPSECSIYSSFGLFKEIPNKPFVSTIETLGVLNQSLWRGSLHSYEVCDLTESSTSEFEGTWLTKKICNEEPGCVIQATDPTIMTNLNNKDGIVVLELKKEIHIKMWYFEKSLIPEDLKIDKPNPESWDKKPYAIFIFGKNCSGAEFTNLKLYLQVTYCPKFIGCEFSDTCMKKMEKTFDDRHDACLSFLENHLLNMPNEQMWEINSIKWYNPTTTTTTSAPTSTTTTTTTTTPIEKNTTETTATKSTTTTTPATTTITTTTICPPIPSPTETVANFRGAWHYEKKVNPKLPSGQIINTQGETGTTYRSSGITSSESNTNKKNDILSSSGLQVTTLDNIEQPEVTDLESFLVKFGDYTQDLWKVLIDPIKDGQSLENYHAETYNNLQKEQKEFHQHFHKQNATASFI